MGAKRRNSAQRRKLKIEPLEPRLQLSADLSLADISLVCYFDTWEGGTILSTDPTGLTYHPGSGHLYIADSEINEFPDHLVGHNIFGVSLNGDTVHRRITSDNSEPTGITYNEFDEFFYVTNDDTHTVTRYDHDLNTPLATVDTRIAVPGANDPEGITSDPATGMLYVVDGKDGGMQVLVYNSSLQYQRRFTIRPNDALGVMLELNLIQNTGAGEGESTAFVPDSRGVKASVPTAPGEVQSVDASPLKTESAAEGEPLSHDQPETLSPQTRKASPFDGASVFDSAETIDLEEFIESLADRLGESASGADNEVTITVLEVDKKLDSW